MKRRLLDALVGDALVRDALVRDALVRDALVRDALVRDAQLDEPTMRFCRFACYLCAKMRKVSDCLHNLRSFDFDLLPMGRRSQKRQSILMCMHQCERNRGSLISTSRLSRGFYLIR